MKVLCHLICNLLLYSFLPGQSTDTLQAYEQLTLGHQFHREHRIFDSAYVYYLRAANLYHQAEQPERYAYAQLRTAFSAHRAKKYKLAESHYKKSLEIYETLYPVDNLKIAAPSMGLGALYAVTGNYYQALIYTVRSLEIKRVHLGESHIDTGVNYYNAGTSYMNYGEYENAMDAYLKALNIYLDHHGEVHQRVSSVYVNMGILYDKRGESEKALEYYQRSIEIDLEVYGEDFYLLAYNYYNMAISYLNLDRLAMAEHYYRKTIAQSEINQLQELHATAHYGLGKIAAEKGYPDEAMEFYQTAIDLFLEYFDSDFPGINHSYRGMAQVLADQGAYLRAHEYLDRNLDLLSRNFGNNHPFIASTYRQLAALYRREAQYEQALEAIEQGYNALKKVSLLENGPDIPDDYSDQHVLLDLVREEAEIFKAKYQASKQIADLKLALSTTERATEFLDQIRRGYLLDDSKLLLQEEAMATFEQAISTSMELYQQTAEPAYLNAMFQFMEKSKATLLSETLQGNSLKKIQGIPDSVLAEEMSTKRKISFTESMLNSTEVDQDSIRNQLFVLKRSYDALAEQIAQEYPRYYDLKYQVQVKTLDDAQQMLGKRQAAVTYFLGQEHWYILAISPEDVSASRIDSTAFSRLDLKGFRAMVSDPQLQWDDHTAYNLYRELIAKPFEKLSGRFERLMVIPDGALGHIPFDALVTSLPGETDGRKSFVVDQYAIAYAPSITFLGFSQADQQPSRDYHGFAPVEYQGGLAPLWGSREEITTSSTLFQGKSYLQKEATESNLKQVSECGIVHLAMHTLVDDQDPMNSRLIFACEADSLEDGNLYASEIYNLKLNSKLAILSACNTGFGEIVRGEGIMNLSRAFQFAGSPNIIMSLWQASDASTTDIMYSFLSNLKSGLPLDQSLQQAKLSYLEEADPLKEHPAFWATFVFVGDSSPVQIHGNLWNWIILGLLIIIAVAWLTIKINFKSNKVVS